MKLARKHRHSSLSIVHYPFSIDSNNFQFAGPPDLRVNYIIHCLPHRARVFFKEPLIHSAARLTKKLLAS